MTVHAAISRCGKSKKETKNKIYTFIYFSFWNGETNPTNRADLVCASNVLMTLKYRSVNLSRYFLYLNRFTGFLSFSLFSQHDCTGGVCVRAHTPLTTWCPFYSDRRRINCYKQLNRERKKHTQAIGNQVKIYKTSTETNEMNNNNSSSNSTTRKKEETWVLVKWNPKSAEMNKGNINEIWARPRCPIWEYFTLKCVITQCWDDFCFDHVLSQCPCPYIFECVLFMHCTPPKNTHSLRWN